jgi:hypothetical protein
MTEFESPAHRRSLLMFVSMLQTEHRLEAYATLFSELSGDRSERNIGN